MTSILVLGNPILDMVAVVEASWFQEHNLIEGAYTEYDKDKHGDIFGVLRRLPAVQLLPGGAAQNTARVVQSMMPSPRMICYLGSVGEDEYADIMEDIAQKQGLEVHYQRHKTAATGKCGVLITKETCDRSMCTDLAAANHFTTDFLQRFWSKTTRAKIIFNAGFFVTASPESITLLAKSTAATEEKLWGTNLSAPFIVETYTTQLREWFKYANFIVGNEREWATVQNTFGLPEKWSLQDVIAHLCRDFEWLNKAAKLRALIVTQGANPTLVAWRPDQFTEVRVETYPVDPVVKELIVDTNGCGDAFIGGFMTGLFRDWPIEKCINLGHICGREVLQHAGLQFDLTAYKQHTSNH